VNKTIYFHCGLPKTGTTAIQQYLTIKAEDGEGNFLYPETGVVYYGADHTANQTQIEASRGRPLNLSAHHDLFRPGGFQRNQITHDYKAHRCRFGGGNYDFSDADMLYEMLLSEISSSNMKKVIISSEIPFGNPTIIASLRTFIESARSDGDEVKCVVYLRSFVEWTKSLHLELCHARQKLPESAALPWPPEMGTDFEKWLTTGLHSWSASAQIPRLVNIFNQKDTIIRYYEGDVVEDFCKVVGIEFDGPKIVSNKTRGESESIRDSLLTDNTRKIIRERHYESESKFADEFLTKEQKSKYLEGILDE